MTPESGYNRYSGNKNLNNFTIQFHMRNGLDSRIHHGHTVGHRQEFHIAAPDRCIRDDISRCRRHRNNTYLEPSMTFRYSTILSQLQCVRR